MIRRLALATALVLAALVGDASAGFVGTNRSNVNGSWYPTPTVNVDCVSGLAPLTVTRASVYNQDNVAGVWSSFANNVLPITNKGCLNEPARTNIAKWSRDLTNVLWVPTTATVLKDQTGIDNAANAASSITATAGNALLLQTIVNASASRALSAFVKCLVVAGCGVINMTMDNVTFTAVTPCASTVFIGSSTCKVMIPVQAAVTNPIIGFQIVTNGDSIAVDGVQIETVTANNEYSTSPIFTTSASVSRAQSAEAVTSLPFLGANMTLAGRFTTIVPDNIARNLGVVSISDGTVNNRLTIEESTTKLTLGNNIKAGVTASVGLGPIAFFNTPVGIVYSSSLNSQIIGYATVGDYKISNGAQIAQYPTGLNAIAIGDRFAGQGTPCTCYLETARIWSGFTPRRNQLRGMLW